MKPLIFIAVLFAVAPSAQAAEWIYCGNTVRPENDAMFYDAKSVTYPDKDAVRVWTEAIPQERIDRYTTKHLSDGQYLDKFLPKVASHIYLPRILTLPNVVAKIPDNQFVSFAFVITEKEIIANSGEVKPLARIYWEFNCRKKQFHSLSVIRLMPDKEAKDHSGIDTSAWQDSDRDSVAEWLSQLVCRT